MGFPLFFVYFLGMLLGAINFEGPCYTSMGGKHIDIYVGELRDGTIGCFVRYSGIQVGLVTNSLSLGYWILL